MAQDKDATHDQRHTPNWPLRPSIEKALAKDLEDTASIGSLTRSEVESPSSGKCNEAGAILPRSTSPSHTEARPISLAGQDSLNGRNPSFEVDFEENDSGNPKNWTKWKRGVTFFVITASNLVVLLYSTSYTATIPGIQKEFDTSRTTAILGLTTYLLGLAAGSVCSLSCWKLSSIGLMLNSSSLRH
jgi:hypothetical protein